MKINTHNIKMRGLKAASGDTKTLYPYGRLHLQISYDLDTGDILTALHLESNWTQYRSGDVIHVCNCQRPLTMQAIADMVAEAVTLNNRIRQEPAC